MYPALQGWHWLEPCAEVNDPGAQVVHRVLADWLENEPALQGRHWLAPAFGCALPGLQLRHTSEVLACVEIEYVPAAHDTQALLCTVLE